MKSSLFLFLLLILLASFVACKADKVDTAPAENIVGKEKLSPKSMVPVSPSNDNAAGVKENISQEATSTEDLVKKEMESIPTAKVIANSPTNTTKVKAKPVKKPKPNPVKSAPVKYMPKIDFDEVSYDFGEIVEGNIINHNFTFTNTGKSNLSIEKAMATCGCTTPSFPFIDIKPGETGYIGVIYNSVNKDGDQKPEITVYSNALQKEMTLYLTGTVKAKAKE